MPELSKDERVDDSSSTPHAQERLGSLAFVDGSVDVNKNVSFSRGAGAAVLISVDRGGPIPLVSGIHLTARYAEGYESVTNNTMELLAFQVVLESVPRGPIHIWSDSKYAIGVLFNKDWRAGQNRELVHRIRALTKDRDIKAYHIPGHSAFFLNELADLVAGRAVKKRKDVDYEVPLAKGTHLACLVCKHFPCDVPHISWRTMFTAIRDRSWQHCQRLNMYVLAARSGTGRLYRQMS